MSQTYTAQDIEVLSGLEPVRRRPGMYTDTTRPNHLAQEVIDNSVDEALAGYCQDRRHPLQGRLARSRRRRSRHAGRHPPEGEGERRRADPHPPARGWQVLRRLELQVLRRPARRGRVGGQCAVEAPRMLGSSRRQGIQHGVRERARCIPSSKSSARSARATPAPPCASGRTPLFRQPRFRDCRSSSTCSRPRRCCARACASASTSRRPARRKSGSTRRGLRSTCASRWVHRMAAGRAVRRQRRRRTRRRGLGRWSGAWTAARGSKKATST